MSASDTIDVSAQSAIVTWASDNKPCCRLEAVKLYIFHDPSTNTAFFKLRAPVTYQTIAANSKRTTAAWLFIAPERIATLQLQGEHEIDETTKKQLGPNAVCLRFDLHRPAVLVLPPDIDQDGEAHASAEALDALRSLTQATSFAVLASLPARAVSQARLLSLCTAASGSKEGTCAAYTSTSGTLISSKHAADTNSLYGGKGGRIIEGGSSALLSTVETNVSPPPYANIGASPPSAPVLEPEKKRKRRASSDAGPGPRQQSPVRGIELKMALEEFKSELRSELKQDLRREFLAELKQELKQELKHELNTELRNKLKIELMAGLKNELANEVIQEVEPRLLQRVEQSLQEQADEFESELHDVRREVGSTVYSEVEDQTHEARKELEEFIKDEMEEAQQRVEDRIVNRLQYANLNLTF
ncbi:hypothetical protein VPNG_02554 [Cytospora leucostoma]|uniref:Uncharacterized protein n=1 Tax=Cytospora leucostoma TaxID=1230097 RepID=A0A423XIG7_9PEZI|nr:hypothetical protein VPNG_02554 [Cytospora leucostoma]